MQMRWNPSGRIRLGAFNAFSVCTFCFCSRFAKCERNAASEVKSPSNRVITHRHPSNPIGLIGLALTCTAPAKRSRLGRGGTINRRNRRIDSTGLGCAKAARMRIIVKKKREREREREREWTRRTTEFQAITLFFFKFNEYMGSSSTEFIEKKQTCHCSFFSTRSGQGLAFDTAGLCATSYWFVFMGFRGFRLHLPVGSFFFEWRQSEHATAPDFAYQWEAGEQASVSSSAWLNRVLYFLFFFCFFLATTRRKPLSEPFWCDWVRLANSGSQCSDVVICKWSTALTTCLCFFSESDVEKWIATIVDSTDEWNKTRGSRNERDFHSIAKENPIEEA